MGLGERRQPSRTESGYRDAERDRQRQTRPARAPVADPRRSWSDAADGSRPAQRRVRRATARCARRAGGVVRRLGARAGAHRSALLLRGHLLELGLAQSGLGLLALALALQLGAHELALLLRLRRHPNLLLPPRFGDHLRPRCGGRRRGRSTPEAPGACGRLSADVGRPQDSGIATAKPARAATDAPSGCSGSAATNVKEPPRPSLRAARWSGPRAAPEGRVPVEDLVELAVGQAEQHARRLGDRGRGARAVVDERDLAQQPAGTDRVNRLATLLDPDASRDDEEEVALVATLMRQLGAGRDLDRVRQLGNAQPFLLIEPGEQRDTRKQRAPILHRRRSPLGSAIPGRGSVRARGKPKMPDTFTTETGQALTGSRATLGATPRRSHRPPGRSAMRNAPIILVPGFWLGAWAWDEVGRASSAPKAST